MYYVFLFSIAADVMYRCILAAIKRHKLPSNAEVMHTYSQ